MMQVGRPDWGTLFDHLNNQKTIAGGNIVGVIDGIDYINHRVNVYVPQYNQSLKGIRFATQWHAGTLTGTHALPPMGAEVQLAPKQGKSYGIPQLEVVYVNFSATWKPPAHPSLKGQENFFARQTAIVTGSDTTPATLELLDNQGGKHELHMGKVTQRSRGVTDSRDDGLSVTLAETHALAGSNLTALASLQAQSLNPLGDMGDLAKGLSGVSNTLAQANQSTSAAAASFADQTLKQAGALNVGVNAGAYASGLAPVDNLS